MKRAVELGPKFASAYADLGTVYENLQQRGLAADNFAKAYELRERVSERERFHILGHYYGRFTGELEKAIPIYQQWEREYPTDATPRTNLGNILMDLGQNENSLVEHQDALRVESNGVLIYENLALSYFSLNRFDEATATVNQAFTAIWKMLAFTQLSRRLLFCAAMFPRRNNSWRGVWGSQALKICLWQPRLTLKPQRVIFRKAREFSRRATESAAQSGSKETAALWQVLGALHETDVDDPMEAAKQADAALALARNRDTLILAALAFARAGKDDRARTIADQLDHRVSPRHARAILLAAHDSRGNPSEPPGRSWRAAGFAASSSLRVGQSRRRSELCIPCIFEGQRCCCPTRALRPPLSLRKSWLTGH